MQHLVLFLVIKIFIVIKCNATILGKVFGAGQRSPVKLDRARKVYYLLLRDF